MEVLARLTRRQLDALRSVARCETGTRGASLNAVANDLGVSAPTALDHLGPLEEMGLIVRHRGKSRLSGPGRTCLDEYVRHHRLAESLFAKAGLSAPATHQAALEVDLVLSHRTVQEICEAAGHPQLCPHGEPIAPCAPAKAGGR